MINKISSIQIIGTQRSGSNLLRLILNQFDEISAPHPPHVLRTFLPLVEYYGDLLIEENFYSLAADIAEFVNANPVPWSESPIEAKDLMNRARDKSLLSLYETLYVFKAQQDDAKVWCCKSMFNEYYVKDIEAEGIKPFYIYVYRDGRDVAASFKKAIVGPKHAYHVAVKWKQDQEKAKQVRSYVSESRFFSIKYEDLILNPKRVLQDLSKKLGLEYSPKLLAYYESSESKRTASSGDMWKNVAKPIIKNNVGKFRTELNQEEVQIFEKVAGQSLLELGYKLTEDVVVSNTEYSNEQVRIFNERNTIMQVEVREKASKHDLKIRSKQEKVLARIKQQFGIA